MMTCGNLLVFSYLISQYIQQTMGRGRISIAGSPAAGTSRRTSKTGGIFNCLKWQEIIIILAVLN
jgi:hypothetical protein